MDDFEKLYNEYYPLVYKFLFKLSADSVLAEELTQETLFRAIQKAHTFKGECKMSTWLCTIAKNLYLAEQKRRKRIENGSAVEDMASTRDIHQELCNKETATQIHVILHQMEEPYKEVFWMRTFGELSFKEIGNMFQKTESWARVTYHRAKIKIREALE